MRGLGAVARGVERRDRHDMESLGNLDTSGDVGVTVFPGDHSHDDVVDQHLVPHR